MYPVTLTGRVVTLREFREDDAADVHAIIGDDRVTTYLSFDNRTMQQATNMIRGIIERSRGGQRIEYYLAATVDGRVVGFIRLALGGVSAAKLGYAVNFNHWGQGYASDMVQTMIEFALDTLNVHRITAAIGPENFASISVVEKVGMKYEGRLRHHVHTNGAWRDSLLYSLLPDDRMRRPDFHHHSSSSSTSES